ELGLELEEDEAVAALCRERGGLEAGRAGADDRDPTGSAVHPAERAVAPVRLTSRARVHDARDRPLVPEPLLADVRADAVDGLVLAPLLRLADEERVGDVRPRHPDHVGRAAREDLLGHLDPDDPADREHADAVADELLRAPREVDHVAL